MMSSVLDSAEYLMLIFQKIAIWSSLVGPQGSWALVHRTTCTTCIAATAGRNDLLFVKKMMWMGERV